MNCKRHKWGQGKIRLLGYTIRRGCQEANAEIYEKCSECGKEKRVTLMNVRPQSVLVGQRSV